MAPAGREHVGATSSKGTLWAKAGNERNSLSLKKAFFFALGVEAAMLFGLTAIDFNKRQPEIISPEMLRAVPLEVPPEVEEKPPEIEPRRITPQVIKNPREAIPEVIKEAAPTPPKEPQSPQTRKENPQQPAPSAVEVPSAAIGSTSTATLPDAAAGGVQGSARATEPAPPAAPAPSVPAPPAAASGPRSIGALAAREQCMAALIDGYPRDARRANQEGNLTALVTVDADGHATKVEITRANPRRVFDRALIRGLMSAACRFTPDPAGYQAIVPFEYRLSGETPE